MNTVNFTFMQILKRKLKANFTLKGNSEKIIKQIINFKDETNNMNTFQSMLLLWISYKKKQAIQEPTKTATATDCNKGRLKSCLTL